MLVDEPLVDYRQHGANEIGAVAPTLGHKLGRLRQPRGPRNARLLARTQELSERVSSWSPRVDAVVEAVEGRLAHEHTRSSLASSRVRRIVPVVRIARGGGCWEFGRGSMDALRDLVQPD